MFLNELLKKAFVTEEEVGAGEILLFPKGAATGVELNFVVKEEDFEQVMLKYRTREPMSDPIMKKIGKTSKISHDPSTLLYRVLARNNTIMSRYMELVTERSYSKLDNESPEEPVETPKVEEDIQPTDVAEPNIAPPEETHVAEEPAASWEEEPEKDDEQETGLPAPMPMNIPEEPETEPPTLEPTNQSEETPAEENGESYVPPAMPSDEEVAEKEPEETLAPNLDLAEATAETAKEEEVDTEDVPPAVAETSSDSYVPPKMEDEAEPATTTDELPAPEPMEIDEQVSGESTDSPDSELPTPEPMEIDEQVSGESADSPVSEVDTLDSNVTNAEAEQETPSMTDEQMREIEVLNTSKTDVCDIISKSNMRAFCLNKNVDLGQLYLYFGKRSNKVEEYLSGLSEDADIFDSNIAANVFGLAFDTALELVKSEGADYVEELLAPVINLFYTGGSNNG